MSRAISRESFDELKNYLGVYLQQGRPLLDADWNENQDIAVAAARRMGRDTHGEGSPDTGFAVVPVMLPDDPFQLTDANPQNLFDTLFGTLRFFLRFPGTLLDDCEQGGFTLSSTQGSLRTATDRPHQGTGFLRLSGHPGTVTIRKTLSGTVNLSTSDLVTFWYRRNRHTAGPLKFFIEDDTTGRTVWPVIGNAAFPPDIWLPAVVMPLDVRFRIVNQTLGNGVVNDFYTLTLGVCGGSPPFTWSATGSLPPGLTLPTDPFTDRTLFTGARLTQSGTFTFTVKATDAAGRTATKQLTLVVQPSGPALGRNAPADLPFQAEMPFETPTGTPADPTRVHAYGFEVPQDSTAPQIWDFDELRLGGDAQHLALAANNFVIRGPLGATRVVDAMLHSLTGQLSGLAPDDPSILALIDALPTGFDPDTPDLIAAARLHVSGLTCLQLADTRYADQADPNDPPLTPPAAGQTRRDIVYADVWTEPVTFVDDPDIREVALGGPDTTTRSRLRYRIRVAQGGDLPAGDGRGTGTLSTSGSYTAQANRLYLVEVDTAGDLGTATFRWSDENASTIQRILQPLPPGSKSVTVEDASGFAPGDRILIRKEFGAEEHQIASVLGNVIGLATPTGGQLAALPAAGRVAGFTTFAVADRPTLQRWNAFRVPIPADSTDPTVSAPVPLNDGVTVRFGGHSLRTGDYWNFRTRFLAGDEATGLDPASRIEQLAFQRPTGVVHHYAPLATLTRGPADPVPELISNITDLRPRSGNAVTVNVGLANTSMTGRVDAFLGGSRLGTVAPDSRLVLFWSGDITVPANSVAELILFASYYNDQMTDPATDPGPGFLGLQDIFIDMAGRPAGMLPFHIVFAQPVTPLQRLGGPLVPTSIQLSALTNNNDDQTISLTNMRAVLLELNKSTELIDEFQA